MMQVPAAGTLPWRHGPDGVEVLLVHRAKYDDWSWPKGKVDPGETFEETAVRETFEEAGYQVRLGVSLPDSSYPLRHGATKYVRYWAAKVVGGDGALENEIDRSEWLTIDAARDRLSYDRDRLQLDALEAAHRRGGLTTWPLLVVRHALAVPRKKWHGPHDWERPLNNDGFVRAQRMVPLIAAYAPEKVVTSSALRCVQTVDPFLAAHDVPCSARRGLSEEGFADDPGKIVRRVEHLLQAGVASALCSHGPVLPAVFRTLAEHAEEGSEVADVLTRRAKHGIDKGEVFVCEVVGTGSGARVVETHRMRP